jgi:hypothetical protein
MPATTKHSKVQVLRAALVEQLTAKLLEQDREIDRLKNLVGDYINCLADIKAGLIEFEEWAQTRHAGRSG